MDIYGYNFRVIENFLYLDESILVKHKGIYYWEYLHRHYEYEDYHFDLHHINSLEGFFIPSNDRLYFKFDDSHLNLRMSELTTNHINSVLEKLGGNFRVEYNI